MRKYRIPTLPGCRICNRCDRELPATPDVFCRDKSRSLGLAYECRACMSARKLGTDLRADRWSNMTPAQRKLAGERNKRYAQTEKGRAIFLRKTYQRIDACDLTNEEMMALVAKPCHYCGTVKTPRGLDRIDNDSAHIRGNVLPCCPPCNFARGRRLSVDEMVIVGKAIRAVMDARQG